jgi:hypothetical protein
MCINPRPAKKREVNYGNFREDKRFVAQMTDEIRHANLALGQMEVFARVLPVEEKRDVRSAKEFVRLLSNRHFLPLLSRRRNKAESC